MCPGALLKPGDEEDLELGKEQWAGGASITLQDVHVAPSIAPGCAHGGVSGLTAAFLPGHLYAITGPLPAVCSSVLGTMAGYVPCVSGSVTISGGGARDAARRRITAFVDSFDTLVPNLTVMGQLQYALNMACPPRSMSEAAKQSRLTDIVELLGLDGRQSAKVGFAYAPGISAEEMRLLSMGVALVASPAVVLVDHPTLGLDLPASARVMRRLAAVAARGTTVVVACGPLPAGAYAVLGGVVALQGGRAAYVGATGEELVAHFTRACPQLPPFNSAQIPESEWLHDILDAPQPDRRSSGLRAANTAELADAWSESPVAKAVEQQAAQLAGMGGGKMVKKPWRDGRLGCCGRSDSVNPLWMQLLLLFKHRTANNLRDPYWLLVRILDKTLFTLLIMTLYWHQAADLDPVNVSNIVSVLWMITLLPGFSAAAYLGFLVLEMPGLLRERKAGWYGTTAWLVHRMTEELVYAAAYSAVLACALFFPMRLHGSFTVFWVAYFLSYSFGIVLGYTLAAIAPTAELAGAALSYILIFLLWFAGVLILTADIRKWWSWMYRIDYLRYCYGAMLINEYGRPGWDTTVLAQYSLYGTSKWRFIGYEALFVAGGLLLLAVVLHFKRTAPRYRIQIQLRQG